MATRPIAHVAVTLKLGRRLTVQSVGKMRANLQRINFKNEGGAIDRLIIGASQEAS